MAIKFGIKMVDENYIGKMDRLIQVIEKTETKSTTGAISYTDVIIAEVWAERKSATSDKEIEDKVVALNVFQYYMHYHPVIASKMMQELYVNDNGLEYEVYGVEELGREDRIRLKCERRE